MLWLNVTQSFLVTFYCRFLSFGQPTLILHQRCAINLYPIAQRCTAFPSRFAYIALKQCLRQRQLDYRRSSTFRPFFSLYEFQRQFGIERTYHSILAIPRSTVSAQTRHY